MHVLVTGASGFIGGAVARRLRARGDHVRAVARQQASVDVLRGQGIDAFVGDVAEKNTLRAPMQGVDAVCHVAGWYKVGVRDETAAVRTNVDGTRNVLELADELGISKVVCTSTLAVNSDTHGRIVDETYRYDGPYLSLYERTKAQAHAIANEHIRRGSPVVIVQPGLVYGPGDSSGVRTLLRQYLKHALPALPRCAAFSWAYIDDIADGHVSALDRGVAGRNYFLAGPSASFVDAIRLAEKICGVPAPRVFIPSAVMRAAAFCAGTIERFRPLSPQYTAEGLRMLAGVTYLGSGERARRELGWTPRSLEEGLRETLRHEMHEMFGIVPSF